MVIILWEASFCCPEIQYQKHRNKIHHATTLIRYAIRYTSLILHRIKPAYTTLANHCGNRSGFSVLRPPFHGQNISSWLCVMTDARSIRNAQGRGSYCGTQSPLVGMMPWCTNYLDSNVWQETNEIAACLALIPFEIIFEVKGFCHRTGKDIPGSEANLYFWINNFDTTFAVITHST